MLDIKMPGIDGYTFCHDLKRSKHFQLIPVIILSALTFPAEVKRGYEYRAVDYILKPWNKVDLVKRIENCLFIVPS